MNINGKTIVAYILLVIDVAVFFFMGYEVAANDAWHYAKFPQIPEGMRLTFVKDTVCEGVLDGPLQISSGTVVILSNIHSHSVTFYYSEDKEVFERFKRLDSLDRLSRSKELGVMYLHADFDCFAEQKRLEQICDEAEKESRSIRRNVFWKDFTPVIPFGLCIAAVGFFFTWLLIKKQWYVLLYVMDIVGMPVVYYGFSLFLYH